LPTGLNILRLLHFRFGSVRLLSQIEIIIASILLIGLITSCGPARPFVPVKEGREYGNPKTPMFVVHARERNQWTLNRVSHHHIFKRLICFNYVCRKMIGRSKTLLVISKKEYIKVIKKNAARGFFDTKPPAKAVKPDSVIVQPDTATIADIRIAPVIPPILKADSLITLNEFLFETNSFKLRPEHYPELNTLSNYLMLHPTLEVSITGHTDNVGGEQHNVTLSTRRAESVAEYLVGRGVNYDKIIFRGLGSAQPIESNETVEGRSKNRRVEILIKNPKK
jgi:outer membrane protein OmpA-like peptidoglycan-associated protein